MKSLTTLLSVGSLSVALIACDANITEPELGNDAPATNDGREGSKDDGFWESLFGGGSDDEGQQEDDEFSQDLDATTADALADEPWEGDSLCETMMDIEFFTEDGGLDIECGPDEPEPEAPLFTDDDPWAMARDIHAHQVFFPEWLEADTYDYPSVSGYSLGGTEFWQKWPGGENPTYSFNDGTAFGRRCMNASAIRFEAILGESIEALDFLKESSNWSGSFFNWNDDYSQSTWSDGSSARLWAWRTTLVKWISQTNKDGSCYLPTESMVLDLATECLVKAFETDGEIQGCTN